MASLSNTDDPRFPTGTFRFDPDVTADTRRPLLHPERGPMTLDQLTQM